MQLCVCACVCVCFVCAAAAAAAAGYLLHAACVLADKICYSVEQHHLLSAPTTLSQNRSGEGETLNEAQRITNPYTSLRFQRSPANICVVYVCVCGMCVREKHALRQPNPYTNQCPPIFFLIFPPHALGQEQLAQAARATTAKAAEELLLKVSPLPCCVTVASSRACAHTSVDRHADAQFILTACVFFF
jgi:hypothetical protein